MNEKDFRKIIIEELTEGLTEGFEKQARFINHAFQEQKDHFDNKFDGLEQRVESLEQGQEQILLRLDRHAYHFDVKDLKTRVTKIEKKIGMK